MLAVRWSSITTLSLTPLPLDLFLAHRATLLVCLRFWELLSPQETKDNFTSGQIEHRKLKKLKKKLEFGTFMSFSNLPIFGSI